MSWLHLFTSGPVLGPPRGWQMQPGPCLCLLCSLLLLPHWMHSLRSLLPTAASVSSPSVMDDHNNSACLAPWQKVLGELMKACRLHTQGAPPGQHCCPWNWHQAWWRRISSSCCGDGTTEGRKEAGLGAGDVAQLLVLAWHALGCEFNSQQCVNQARWHMPSIPILQCKKSVGAILSYIA